MSYENHTPLRVGATGTLDGWRVRVAGRVVMSMEEDGETYYWNEFNLVDGFGRSATLVLEETEDGPEWKLFKPFAPIRAMSAAEAAQQRVGDRVNLDGAQTPITLVDQSRVSHIEGTAPEGTEVGDVAHYFNADAGTRMLVVSWTGDEIEFYEGHDVPAERVAQAFGVSLQTSAVAPPSLRPLHQGGAAINPGNFTKIVGVVLSLVCLFAFYSCNWGRGSTSAPARAGPPPKQAAPALRLTPGARGALAQRDYLIANHALIEVARIGGRQDRHEYALRGSDSDSALLVNGLTGNPREWHLLQPLGGEPALGTMDPFDAATRRKGAPVRIGERTLEVSELFQSKLLAADATGTGAAWSALQYGFVASRADEWLIARWNQAGIQFHLGRRVTEAEVLAAFGAGAQKAK